MSDARVRTEVKTRTPELKVFPSGRGKDATNYTVTYNGFVYGKHSSNDDKHIFRCFRHHSGCHARLHLSLSHRSVVYDSTIQKPHTHDSDSDVAVQRYAMWKMKSTAMQCNDSTIDIIASSLTVTPKEVQGSFQKYNSLRRLVQRSRLTSKLPSLRATSRLDLPLLEGRFKTRTNEDFLLYDSGPRQDRLVIFTTADNLDWLQASDHWFHDGTFKSQPLLFDQLFVIHGLRTDPDGNLLCVPLVYCLTPNRVAKTYKKIFKKLKQHQPGLAPLSIMSDFEQASLTGFRKVFPAADQRGCFFHFRQSILRRIRTVIPDLNALMNTDAEINLNIRKLIALAFVPPADVVASYEELDDSPFFQAHRDDFSQLMDYFQATWIGNFDRTGRRKSPMYPIPLWNCWDSVVQGLPKTNNFCEGFHTALSSLLSVHHPKIDRFVNGLMKQQTISEFRMEQFVSCQSDPACPQQLAQINRLKGAVAKYGTISTLEFLRGVAHCIKY